MNEQVLLLSKGMPCISICTYIFLSDGVDMIGKTRRPAINMPYIQLLSENNPYIKSEIGKAAFIDKIGFV